MKEYLCRTFAANAGLPDSLVFTDDLTLAEIVSRSERMHNSVDLIEAFARTANSVERDFGIRVRLPAFSLETRISTVLDSILQEIETQRQNPSTGGGEIESKV
jgi:hypothetical protein